MGFKRLFNSLLAGSHYRLVNKDDYERIFASKDAGINASDGGRSITEDLVKLCPKHQAITVFDVGANKGGTQRLFRSLFPKSRIYCFEPDKRMQEKLQKAAGDDPLVQIHPVAVSDMDGEIEFHLTRASETNSILAPLQTNETSLDFVVEKVKVPTVMLDTFATKAGLGHVHLLKMDIQGAEIRALEGASRLLGQFQIDCIYLELVFSSDYEAQALATNVIDYLRGKSYDLYGLYNFNYHGNILHYCDGLFVPSPNRKA